MLWFLLVERAAKYRFFEGCITKYRRKRFIGLKEECPGQNFKVKDRSIHRREWTVIAFNGAAFVISLNIVFLRGAVRSA